MSKFSKVDEAFALLKVALNKYKDAEGNKEANEAKSEKAKKAAKHNADEAVAAKQEAEQALDSLIDAIKKQ